MMGIVGFGLREPDRFEMAIDGDLGSEPDLRKIGKVGAETRKRIRPFAFLAAGANKFFRSVRNNSWRSLTGFALA